MVNPVFRVRDMVGNVRVYTDCKGDLHHLRMCLAIHHRVFHPCIALLSDPECAPMEEFPDSEDIGAKLTLDPGSHAYAVNYVNNEQGMEKEMHAWTALRWIEVLHEHVKWGDRTACERGRTRFDPNEALQGIVRRTRTVAQLEEDLPRVELLLQLEPALNINSRADGGVGRTRGSTLLQRAAFLGHMPTIRWCVEARASVEARDAHGFTAVHDAAACGHEEATRYLIQVAGADPLATELYGRSPIHLAAVGGHVRVLKLLVEEAGVDVNMRVQKTKDTALSYAMLSQHADAMRVLVNEYGATI